MEERCVLCGATKEIHYDGVQCPVGPDTYSSTQEFTPPNSLRGPE
jgi:hypothetical protein